VELIDGHLRQVIFQRLGPDTLVPVVLCDLDDAEAKKANLLHDPLAGLAETDSAKLDALLREVQTPSQELAGVLDDLAREAGCEWTKERDAAARAGAGAGGGDGFDATPEESGPTRTAVGDLWVIGGKHRLLVGDCTVAENVARLMAGRTVGLCFTSPPYAQQRDYGAAAKEKVQDWHALMCGAFACLPMADAGQVLVNLGLVHREGEWVPYWDGWIEWMREQGWRRFGWYVWDQGPGMPGDWAGRLAPSHEFVWHFNRNALKPTKTKECKHAGEVQSKRTFRNKDGSLDGFTHAGHAVQSHKIMDSVVRVTRKHGTDAHGDHPAAFPVGLPSAFLECWPGDIHESQSRPSRG
jgi:DNA modification methylase